MKTLMKRIFAIILIFIIICSIKCVSMAAYSGWVETKEFKNIQGTDGDGNDILYLPVRPGLGNQGSHNEILKMVLSKRGYTNYTGYTGLTKYGTGNGELIKQNLYMYCFAHPNTNDGYGIQDTLPKLQVTYKLMINKNNDNFGANDLYVERWKTPYGTYSYATKNLTGTNASTIFGQVGYILASSGDEKRFTSGGYTFVDHYAQQALWKSYSQGKSLNVLFHNEFYKKTRWFLSTNPNDASTRNDDTIHPKAVAGGTQYYNESLAYANYINSNKSSWGETIIKKVSNDADVKTKQVKISNKNYLVLGPFKINYSQGLMEGKARGGTGYIEDGHYKGDKYTSLFGGVINGYDTKDDVECGVKIYNGNQLIARNKWCTCDKNGNETSTNNGLIPRNSNFYIRVDANSVTKVEFHAVHLVVSATIYTIRAHDAAQFQAITGDASRKYIGQKVEYEVASIVTGPDTGNLKIIKKDAETETELNGAKFTVYNNTTGEYCYMDNNEKIAYSATEEEVTVNGTLIMQGLKLGKYTVTEVQAPNGYNLEEQTDIQQTDKVRANKTTPFTFINEKDDSGGDTGLRIRKRDAVETDKPLSAKFTVYNNDTHEYCYYILDGIIAYSSSKQIVTVPAVSGGLVMKGLKVGSYTVTEVEGPDEAIYPFECQTGKTRTKQVVEGTITKMKFTNKPYGNYMLIKVDSQTKEGINGIGFKIKNSSNEYIKNYNDNSKPSEVTFTTNKAEAKTFWTKNDGIYNGIIMLKNIPQDEYTAIETDVSTTESLSLLGIPGTTSDFYKANGQEYAMQGIKGLSQVELVRKIYTEILNDVNQLTVKQLLTNINNDFNNISLSTSLSGSASSIAEKLERNTGSLKTHYYLKLTPILLNKEIEIIRSKINPLKTRRDRFDITDAKLSSYINKIKNKAEADRTETEKSILESYNAGTRTFTGEEAFEIRKEVCSIDSADYDNYIAYLNSGGHGSTAEEDAAIKAAGNLNNLSKEQKEIVMRYAFENPLNSKQNAALQAWNSQPENFNWTIDSTREKLESAIRNAANRADSRLAVQNLYNNRVSQGKYNEVYEDLNYNELVFVLNELGISQTLLGICGSSEVLGAVSSAKNAYSYNDFCNEVLISKINSDLVNRCFGSDMFYVIVNSKYNFKQKMDTYNQISTLIPQIFRNHGKTKSDLEIREYVFSSRPYFRTTIENDMGGELIIYKTDGDTQGNVTATFTLSTTVNGVKYYWDDSQKCFSTTKKTFQVSGEKSITHLPGLDYELEEVGVQEGYTLELQDDRIHLIHVDISSTKEEQFVNTKYGRIEIQKLINGTTKPLKGAEFELYTEKNRSDDTRAAVYIRDEESGNLTPYPSETYTTGADGKVVIEYLRMGTYWLYESKEPDYYEVIDATDNGVSEDENYKWTEVVVNSDVSQVNKVVSTIYNRQRLVDISGYVWEDIGETKATVRNELYTSNGKDQLVNHVRVRLVDRRDPERKTVLNEQGDPCITYTDVASDEVQTKEGVNTGAYEFKRVFVYDIENYYVEFEYNGISYESVAFKMEDNGSKAVEGANKANRTQMDNNFTTINPGEANNSGGERTTQLSYNRDTENHTSTLLYGNTDSQGQSGVVKGYDSANYPIYGADNNRDNFNTTFLIIADTWNGYASERGNDNGSIITADEIRAQAAQLQEGEYTVPIKHINLGLYERERPDISLLKDVDNVKMSINGFSHIYKYENKMKHYTSSVPETPKDGQEAKAGIGLGVIWKQKYTGMSYKRAIYESDIVFEHNSDSNKNLKVYLTYKIAMINSATNLEAKINSLIDYYDENYQLVAIGDGDSLDESQGTIIGNIPFNEVSSDRQGYKKIQINTDKVIANQQTEYLYVQFELNKDTIKNILLDNGVPRPADQIDPLDNVVEINSYTSYYPDTQNVYGGIDEFSAPGNATPGDINTYENDTDAAPTVNLELASKRTLNGKVFKDNSTIDENKIETGQIRQGNGKYDDGEAGIESVKVTLTETTGTGKVYEATTGSDGDFSISDYIPGEYKLEYEWGDSKYTVQDYKGTIYDKSRYELNKADITWYRQNINTQDRYQDATDNYDMRQEIDQEINPPEQMNNLYKKYVNTYTQGATGEKLSKTRMISSALPFGVGLEYDDNILYDQRNTPTTTTGMDVDNNVQAQQSVDTNQDGSLMKIHEISNMDFGITLRPKQEMYLDKSVSNLTITLPNGNKLIDAEVVEENGVKKLKAQVVSENGTEDVKYVVYLPKSAANGSIKAEINSELIQSSKLSIKYRFTIKNISEIDYIDKDFYVHGITPGEDKMVTIKPRTIIDYLDNGVEASEGWKILSDADKQKYLDDGYIEKEIEPVLKGNDIFINETEMTQELKPITNKDTVTAEMESVKLLANNNDIDISNEAELIISDKNGGTLLQSTPGNYNPAASSETGENPTSENDDSKAEDTIITPPTGAPLGIYTICVIISIITLGVIATIIVIVKKRHK